MESSTDVTPTKNVASTLPSAESGADILTAKRLTSYQGGNKRLIIFGTSIILVAAVATLIVVIVAPSNEEDRCQVIRKSAAEGRDFSQEYDVAEINECENFGCTFDVGTCEIECPLGFETDDNRCEISCQCATDSKGTFQGDIQFDESEVNDLLMRYGHASIEKTFEVFASSVLEMTNLWSTRVGGRVQIPYELDESLEEAKPIIDEAIVAFKKETCIDFVPRDKEVAYITFKLGIGCWSSVGMSGKRQDVAIGKNCKTPGIIMHELMHSLGFEHEHIRPDRDAFIRIYPDRIKKKYLRNFAKIRAPVMALGRPYDFASVTHYGSSAWAIDHEEPTFTTVRDELVIGQRRYLSTEDIKEINILYECPGATTDNGIEGIKILTATPPVEEAPVAPGDPTKPPTTTKATTTPKPTEATTQSGGIYWSEWSDWSDCTKTCGLSEAMRFRSCLKNAGEAGNGCEGGWFETRACEKEECPGKTGEWEQWHSWESCSKTCSRGHQYRKRKCPEGEYCFGYAIDGRPCESKATCP